MPVTLTCLRCGGRFFVNPARATSAVFCSHACRKGRFRPSGPRTTSVAYKALAELFAWDGQTSVELAARLSLQARIVNTACAPHIGTLLRKALDEHPEHKCAGVNRFWLTPTGRDVMRKKLAKVVRQTEQD